MTSRRYYRTTTLTIVDASFRDSGGKRVNHWVIFNDRGDVIGSAASFRTAYKWARSLMRWVLYYMDWCQHPPRPGRV